MKFSALEIEITRDCNLCCPHCMRYEPDESMDAYRGSVIKKEYIDKLFEQHHVFDMILLTGGEPLLHPEMITYIIDQIIEKEIVVLQLQLITNGTIMSEEVVSSVNRLYEYINDSFYTEPCLEAITFGISEGYHDNKNKIDMVLEYYKQNLFGTVKLMNSETPSEGEKGILITYSGRAKNIPVSETLDILPESMIHKIALDEDCGIVCMLDLTIHGNFVIGAAHSFQQSDMPENIICSIDDDLLRGIVQWNYMHPMNCEEADYRLGLEYSLQQERYFNKPLTIKQQEDFPMFIDMANHLENGRKNIHDCFPYLYPDDIERLQTEANDKGETQAEASVTFFLWNMLRRKQDVDFCQYCTCPKTREKN